MLEQTRVSCPYCGEQFDTSVDCSAGDTNYIEDCYVCCRPIVFHVFIHHTGELDYVHTATEND